jgi:hypothetical protein
VEPQGPPGQQYPGQRTASDTWVAALVDEATKFWRARGVNVPAPPAVLVLTAGEPTLWGAFAWRARAARESTGNMAGRRSRIDCSPDPFGT